MVARIDRNRRSERARTNALVVQEHMRIGRLVRVDHDVRKRRFESGGALARHALALRLTGAAGYLRRLDVLGPGARRPAGLLVAEREIHQRSGLGVDAIALGKLGARRREIPRRHELAARAKERFGDGARIVSLGVRRPSDDADGPY
jgi:hypothetical protein